MSETGINPFLKEVRMLPKFINIAVLCPPGAALTVVLNIMADHGGSFILMQGLAVQSGTLSKANGQAQVQNFPMLIFSIRQKEFEEWLSVKYDPMQLYNMGDILAGKIPTENRTNIIPGTN